MSKEKIERPLCFYHGPFVGVVKCNCANTVRVSTCFNENVVSGYCSKRDPKAMMDGPLKLGDGQETKELYVPFPFDKDDLYKGKTPWVNMVLICERCPWYTEPPAEVLAMYARREELAAQIKAYEEAPSLDERRAAKLD